MHKTFFGDRERAFALTHPMCSELERITGRGMGYLCTNLVQGNFHLAEIIETIRLALIGGGTDPQEAAALVKTYVPVRPLGEAHILAATILNDLWAGAEATAEQKVNQGTDDDDF